MGLRAFETVFANPQNHHCGIGVGIYGILRVVSWALNMVPYLLYRVLMQGPLIVLGILGDISGVPVLYLSGPY